MYRLMTICTNWNNFQWLRIVWMMIMLCGFATFAIEKGRSQKFIDGNCIVNNCSCFFPLRMPKAISFLATFLNISAFLCFSISGMIRFHADFTIRLITIKFCLIYVKFRNWFFLLAFKTGFGYYFCRHFCFSIKQLCLRLRQVHPCLCLSILSSQANLSTSILGGNF